MARRKAHGRRCRCDEYRRYRTTRNRRRQQRRMRRPPCGGTRHESRRHGKAARGHLGSHRLRLRHDQFESLPRNRRRRDRRNAGPQRMAAAQLLPLNALDRKDVCNALGRSHRLDQRSGAARGARRVLRVLQLPERQARRRYQPQRLHLVSRYHIVSRFQRYPRQRPEPARMGNRASAQHRYSQGKRCGVAVQHHGRRAYPERRWRCDGCIRQGFRRLREG